MASPSPLSSPLSIFTLTSLLSFLAVLTLLSASFLSASLLLPKSSSRTDRFTFVWLAFDALIHFSFEGSWLALSFPPPRTVNQSTGVFATLWKEYAQADTRWGVSDPAVVSLELLTVLGGGPIACWIMWQTIKGDRGRHYWIVVLSTAELYGGWMTFSPEWLTGNQALNNANSWIHLWLHLTLMNGIWVVIPLWLMIDSFSHITKALRDPLGYAKYLEREEVDNKKKSN